jgi:hypothetical protein
MDNTYIVGIAVSIVFLIFKFFEIRFILKEKVNVKKLLIDTFLTYISVVVGYFVIEQFSDKAKNLTQAPVFIDNPKF